MGQFLIDGNSHIGLQEREENEIAQRRRCTLPLEVEALVVATVGGHSEDLDPNERGDFVVLLLIPGHFRHLVPTQHLHSTPKHIHMFTRTFELLLQLLG